MRYFITLLILSMTAASSAYADEYYDSYTEMPCLNVHLSFQNSVTNHDVEIKLFSDIVRAFAATNGLHTCHNPDYQIYSGPPLCAFKGSQLQIFTAEENPAKSFVIIEISAVESAHLSNEDFKSRVSPLIKSLQDQLAGEIKVSDGRIRFK